MNKDCTNIIKLWENTLSKKPLDVLFDDAKKRIYCFLASHQCINFDDIHTMGGFSSVEQFYNSYAQDNKLKNMLSKFSTIRQQTNGRVAYGWPRLFSILENIKMTNEPIRNLFLDFDMEHLSSSEKSKHPLTQNKGMQSYDTHLQQINTFHENNPQIEQDKMLYYHPSGQGAAEYLANNKNQLSPLIDHIYVHCKSEPNSKIMIQKLQAAGYPAVSRTKSTLMNDAGFIVN
jgi:hypothetical protein